MLSNRLLSTMKLRNFVISSNSLLKVCFRKIITSLENIKYSHTLLLSKVLNELIYVIKNIIIHKKRKYNSFDLINVFVRILYKNMANQSIYMITTPNKSIIFALNSHQPIRN